MIWLVGIPLAFLCLAVVGVSEWLVRRRNRKNSGFPKSRGQSGRKRG